MSKPLLVFLFCLVGTAPLRRQDGPATRVEPLAQEVALFDGQHLDEWVLYTEADGKTREGLCRVEDDVLRIAGRPTGYLATRRWYRDYTLELEWRWPGERGGNSGVLVHTTAPLLFYGWPKSMEVQLQAGSAGDFWVIGDGVDIHVENEKERRAEPREGDLHTHRRIANLTDDSEKPVGEWNAMRIECRADRVRVWVNGTLVNDGQGCTVTEGAIALQSEGTPIEFRGIRLKPLVP
ncbi:MAG: DUF1080 domain-containing protein [bacterium]|nr:DUF1080 domain-containing protein [bacterium]